MSDIYNSVDCGDVLTYVTVLIVVMSDIYNCVDCGDV